MIKLPSYFRITSDFVFKLVFKHEQYAKHLIEKILGQTIRSIKSVEAEKVVNDDDIGANRARTIGFACSLLCLHDGCRCNQ